MSISMHTGSVSATPSSKFTSGKRNGVIFDHSTTLSQSNQQQQHLRSSSLSPYSPYLIPLQPVSSNEAEPARVTRSASTPTNVTSGRKFSRKLPPQLTESLELLSLYPTSQPEPTPSVPIQLDLFPKTYTLSVDLPANMSTAATATSPPASPKKLIARKPVDRSSISGPVVAPRSSVSSTSTEADTLPPLTPKTSMPFLGPRSGLFAAALPSRAIHPSASSSSFAPSTTRDSADHSHFAPSEDVPALSCSSGSATGSTCGTWSSFDIEYHPEGRRQETRKERKSRKAAEKERFDESTPPTTKELYEASLMDVIDETGARVRFGDLVRNKKTIVVFIRHWFCPLCAQYIKSVIQDVSRDALEDAGVELIIIGNGSSKMINGYANKYFNSPFKTYTDPSLALYRVLGLTRQTGDAGPDSERGDYLTETALETTVNTLKRATKMPLRNPGHFTQLGGEFVFDGTMNVVYTHRMVNTRNHAPIRDVCAEAGVRLEYIHYEPGPAPPPVHLASTDMLATYSAEEVDGEELDNWVSQKEKTLDRIKMARAERRRGSNFATSDARSEREVQVVIPEEEGVREFGQWKAEERFDYQTVR